MKALSLDEIRTAVQARWRARGTGMIQSVSTDSRTAGPGELFVALRGERFDGHAFLDKAAAAGCAAAMVAMDADVPEAVLKAFPAGVIGVDDTITALGRLAAFHRKHCPATVIGVTGSNGKTTVKRMIHHLLSQRLTGACSPKSFNNEIGVPLTLLAAGANDDYIVCEIGSNAPGEIAALGHLAEPDIAVITSVGPTHLEKLGDVERVVVEKASLLGCLAGDGLAIVNADSEPLVRVLKAYPCRMIRFGESADADLRLTDRHATAGGQEFRMNDRLRVHLPLPGRHNAVNALAAIAVAQRMGLDAETAVEAMADFHGADMRFQSEPCGRGVLINDAYNANPASLTAAAETLAEMSGGRKVLIGGDMRELGDQAEVLHRDVGRHIAESGIDLVIGIGDLGRYIGMGAADGGAVVEMFPTVAEAAKALGGLLRADDVVLIKGSRVMAMEQLVEPIRQALSDADSNRTSKGTER